MDFGQAFSFVFKDPDWFKKLAIVALIGLIPIIGQMIVLGWGLAIAKRVMDHDPNPLPDVEFTADLVRGFYAFLIGLVYTLPITILSSIFGIFNAVAANSSSGDAAVAMVSVLSICLSIFSFIYGLACGFVLPAAYTNFLAKNSLAAGFNLSQVFGLVKANPGAYLIVLLGTIVAGFIAPIGVIACVIGVLLTYAYSMAIMGHFYGQAHNEATKNLAAAPLA